MKPALRDAGDTSEDVSEPGLRIDVVELRGHDQRGHDRGAIGTAFRAGEQPGFAPQRKAAQGNCRLAWLQHSAGVIPPGVRDGS